jgi:sortase A
MLLKVGIAAISVSSLLALAVAAVVFFSQKEAEPVALASEQQAKTVATPEREEPPPPPWLTIGEDASAPVQAQAEAEPETEANVSEQAPQPARSPQTAKSPSEPKAKPARRPEPELQPEPDPGPQPGLDPLSAPTTGWPIPAQKEVESASKPRRYSWTNGAIMSLTVDALGIYNAPVMGSDTEAALMKGVGHVPETSLPWDRSSQTNVYLAAHRYGWPNTGSRLLFFNLNKLRSGDEVVLKNRQGKTYRYRVSETLVVDPSDRWVMGQVVGEHMVTLQTCTPIPTFEKRLIVRADRV